LQHNIAPSAVTVAVGKAVEFNRQIVKEFRANHGRVGAQFEGVDLLLLTTVGAKSEQEHTVPVRYVRDGGRLLIVASAGGSLCQPAWYHNLLAHPMVQVETGIETYGAVAVPAEGQERGLLFERVAREAPEYADHQARTTRLLPVVALERSYVVAGLSNVATLADGLVAIHDWLRGLLRHVRAESDAHFAARAAHHGPGDAPEPSLSLQLRQHCLAFCEALHGHHADEDARILPDLERRHPRLHDVLERLRDEHRIVAQIQGELAELLADIRTAEPSRFRTELDRMCTELEAHLDYEEESLIPVLADIPLPSARGRGGQAGDGA
jgi:deazaflavin-dependent oxidoreductase (nitroreductase family)